MSHTFSRMTCHPFEIILHHSHVWDVSAESKSGERRMVSTEWWAQNGERRMVSAEWWAQNGEHRMVSAQWWAQNGEHRMVSTEWWTQNGERRMVSAEWWAQNGERRMASAGLKSLILVPDSWHYSLVWYDQMHCSRPVIPATICQLLSITRYIM